MRDTLGSCGSHKATPLEATPSHPMSKLEHVPASNFHITIQPKVGLVIYEVLGGVGLASFSLFWKFEDEVLRGPWLGNLFSTTQMGVRERASCASFPATAILRELFHVGSDQ